LFLEVARGKAIDSICVEKTNPRFFPNTFKLKLSLSSK